MNHKYIVATLVLCNRRMNYIFEFRVSFRVIRGSGFPRSQAPSVC